MKNKIIIRSFLILIMVAAFGTITMAQGHKAGPKKAPMEMRMKRMLPDLSDDQIAKIKAYRLEMMKEVTPLKAQIKEKKAHLQVLSIAEEPDMKAINATIDEISKLQAKLMKTMAQFRQNVRAILTVDQRIVFDNMMQSGAFHKKVRAPKNPHHSKTGK